MQFLDVFFVPFDEIFYLVNVQMQNGKLGWWKTWTKRSLKKNYDKTKLVKDTYSGHENQSCKQSLEENEKIATEYKQSLLK